MPPSNPPPSPEEVAGSGHPFWMSVHDGAAAMQRAMLDWIVGCGQCVAYTEEGDCRCAYCQAEEMRRD